MAEQRRLAAILAADMVGYSRLMEADERGTIARQKTYRTELIDPKITEYNGRIVKTTGDGLLAEFASVVDAVKFALAIQREINEWEVKISDDLRIRYRIGINIGDIVVDGDDIFGEGVNVAARLEGLCQPGEVYLSGSAHDQVNEKIEVYFENLGKHSVKNISKPIQVYRVSPDSKVNSIRISSRQSNARSLSDKPSIAVLPFGNLSGDPDQEYFSDGISEDIITALSRIGWLMVIARGSAFSYKDQSVDVRKIAEQLDVRYVLEGSVRKGGNRIRISAELVDGRDGSQLWAENFDRELDDIFAVQDEITQTVVSAIKPEIARAERYKATISQPDSLTTWDIYQRAMWYNYQQASSESRDKVEALLIGAVERDQNFSRAYSALVHNSYVRIINGWSRSDDELDRALMNARKAVELDSTDGYAHTALMQVYLLSKEPIKAIRECEIALKLNPSSYYCLARCGSALVFSGKFEDGISTLEKAIKLGPNEPDLAIVYTRMAEAHMGLENFEIAVEMAEEAGTKLRRGIWVHASLVAALGHVGRIEDAKLVIQELIERVPNFTCAYLRDNYPATDTHLIQVYIDGLQKAGVPDN